jgi:hypothetical protein
MDTYVASTPAVRTSRTSRIHVGFIGLALVGGLALGAVLASRAISVDSTPHGAPGALAMGFAAYPPHYGLAGPSQVRPNPRTMDRLSGPLRPRRPEPSLHDRGADRQRPGIPASSWTGGSEPGRRRAMSRLPVERRLGRGLGLATGRRDAPEDVPGRRFE